MTAAVPPSRAERGEGAPPGLSGVVGDSGGVPGSAVPAVRLRGVRKRFGYREVLRGVDLEVPRGGCLALLGPNGAGKSTLLRILATQWMASEGRVEILGRDVARDAAGARRSLGAVFHASALRAELTLEENLRFFADLYAVKRPEHIDVLVERFGLAHRRKDSVATFSQGMTTRANLIRSLLHNPALWLLDEPFSGLDAAGREVLAASIRSFAAGGGTVIFVTHELDIARSLARDGVVVEDGVLRAAALDGRPGADSASGAGPC